MSTITTIAAEVATRMGNRTDIAARSQQWVAESLLELTSTYPFEELEITGASTALTASTRTYAVTTFSTASDIVQTILDFRVYTDQPTNTVLRPLRRIDIMEADKTSPSVTGIPRSWARWGANVDFVLVPDKAYSVIMRYRRQHPLTGSAPYATTTILLPVEWEDILIVMGMIRGYQELKEHDRAAALKLDIYGGRDPVTGVDRPGAIAKRMMKKERELGSHEIPLKVTMRPSGYMAQR